MLNLLGVEDKSAPIAGGAASGGRTGADRLRE
jgi:hypothetical protein